MIDNVAPSASFGSPAVVNEGDTIGLTLTNPVDVAADLPSLEYAFDCGDGSGLGPFGASNVILKPDNILLSDESRVTRRKTIRLRTTRHPALVPKITDFGLATFERLLARLQD